jgi:ubiquinone/menaquinone biosynthesis C-methylase UbiE
MARPSVSLFARALFAGDFAAVRARIRQHLGERGRRTLDLACGPGLFADVFAGEDYVGLDPDLRSIAWARRARPGAFLVATPRRVDLPDGRFDQALACGVLEMLTDPEIETLLRELRRLVVPTGRVLFISELPQEGLAGRLLPGPRPTRSADAVRRLLRAPLESFASGRRLYGAALVRWT